MNADGSPVGGSGAGSGRRRSPRRWWISAAVVVVVALVAAGVTAVLLRSGGHDSRRTEPPIGTPKDLLVSFPLDRQPVPGWRLTAMEIGLPAGVKVGDFIGSVGSKAFFVADNGCRGGTHCASWLYGIDTAGGKRLFAPVLLDRSFSLCTLNGPSTAVCEQNVTDACDGDRACLRDDLVWVIDLDRGVVTYTGSGVLGKDDRVEQVGLYTVVDNDQGANGVGAHGELTWHVDGEEMGSLPIYAHRDGDIPPLTLTRTAARGAVGEVIDRVFSVVDGKEVTPTAPTGIKLEGTEIYSGGFAFQFSKNDGTAGTIFYDDAGHEVARQQPARSYPRDNVATPTLEVGGSSQVYTYTGTLVREIPDVAAGGRYRTVGTKLFVYHGLNGSAEQTWRQWDLLTGAAGPVCTVNLDAYVGSDGNIVIASAPAKDDHRKLATDPDTCQTRWATSPDVLVWKVGTGLIERTAANDAIESLKAPAE